MNMGANTGANGGTVGTPNAAASGNRSTFGGGMASGGTAGRTSGVRWWAMGVLVVATALTLTPLGWLVINAFKTSESITNSLWLPRDESGRVDPSLLTLKNFQTLLATLGIGRALLNSIFLSSSTALLATLFCAAGGYALARLDFRGRKLVTAIVLAAVLVPGPLLLAPGYQLLYSLNLLDSFAGLILPAIAPAFGVFLFRQAVITGVPRELMESARIDGCGEIRLFASIVLPLVRPMIGTFVMITFLGAWNNFIGPQIVLQSPEKFPLSVAVAQLRGLYYQDYGLQLAGTLLAIAPVFAIFVLVQKDFISGLAAGAVKG
ncbi:MAG: carbohydrate ABC transporter permease [Planctomycetota bacterium]|nr:carbohydrate ABC transporter permease [Planctomycetota bacterium]